MNQFLLKIQNIARIFKNKVVPINNKIKINKVCSRKSWLICLKNCFLSGQSTRCEMAPALAASAHTWPHLRTTYHDTKTIISSILKSWLHILGGA